MLIRWSIPRHREGSHSCGDHRLAVRLYGPAVEGTPARKASVGSDALPALVDSGVRNHEKPLGMRRAARVAGRRCHDLAAERGAVGFRNACPVQGFANLLHSFRVLQHVRHCFVFACFRCQVSDASLDERHILHLSCSVLRSAFPLMV